MMLAGQAWSAVVTVDLDLDIDALIASFEGESPAGSDPREDASAQSLYYRLRDARAEAREAERRADGDAGDAGGPPQQWRSVRDLATRILRERAKDLEIAAWLTEALVREAGVVGVMAGATIIGRLVGAYWDRGLFPTPDEDGVATLLAPVAGLNGASADGTLAQAIRKQAMFVGPDGGELTFWQYFQAEEVEGIGDAVRKKARLDAGVPPFATVERDARAAGATHFGQLRGSLDQAIQAWDGMAQTLDEKAGADAPATGRVRELLLKLLDAVMRFAPARATAEVEEATAPEATAAGAEPAGVAALPVATRAVTREDMLRELGKIADFFRKSEPQSPLPLTLDDAIRRARLSWQELLEEVVANEEARNAMLLQLGIRPPKKDD